MKKSSVFLLILTFFTGIVFAQKEKDIANYTAYLFQEINDGVLLMNDDDPFVSYRVIKLENSYNLERVINDAKKIRNKFPDLYIKQHWVYDRENDLYFTIWRTEGDYLIYLLYAHDSRVFSIVAYSPEYKH